MHHFLNVVYHDDVICKFASHFTLKYCITLHSKYDVMDRYVWSDTLYAFANFRNIYALQTLLRACLFDILYVISSLTHVQCTCAWYSHAVPRVCTLVSTAMRCWYPKLYITCAWFFTCFPPLQTLAPPMQSILSRLRQHNYIKIVVFSDHIILHEPVCQWPVCDCLIAFFSKGFPLNKAVAYVNLHKPMLFNNLEMQYHLQSRYD